jgi:hypothetical protein
MPMEGQWDRARTPLSGRDRRLIAIFCGLAVVAAAAALAAYLTGSHDRSNTGCITRNVASTMGGASVKTCGAAARRLCATQGRVSPSITARCEELGYRLPPIMANDSGG